MQRTLLVSLRRPQALGAVAPVLRRNLCVPGPPNNDIGKTVLVNNFPRMERWTEVRDDATGGVYYWNEETDETTAVGETPEQYIEAKKQESQPAHYASAPPPEPAYESPSFFQIMQQGFFWGAGISIAFAFVRMFIG